jgi:hypothetical protein
MAQDFRSPIDDDGTGATGVGMLATVLGVAVAVLLLGNGGALVAWAEARPPGPGAARAVAAAHAVSDPAEQAGLQAPINALRACWNSIKAARWPGQDAGDQR